MGADREAVHDEHRLRRGRRGPDGGITELPEHLRQVIVLRDVHGHTPAQVQQALGIRAEDGRALLHQARGIVRARLERVFEGKPVSEGNST